MPESTGWTAMLPIERAVCESKLGAQLVPPSKEVKTPPSAAPSQRWLASLGSRAREEIRPPTLLGPAGTHEPVDSSRRPAERASARARESALTGTIPSDPARWRQNQESDGSKSA